LSSEEVGITEFEAAPLTALLSVDFDLWVDPKFKDKKLVREII
jgi:hypothetical protein